MQIKLELNISKFEWVAFPLPFICLLYSKRGLWFTISFLLLSFNLNIGYTGCNHKTLVFPCLCFRRGCCIDYLWQVEIYFFKWNEEFRFWRLTK